MPVARGEPDEMCRAAELAPPAVQLERTGESGSREEGEAPTPRLLCPAQATETRPLIPVTGCCGGSREEGGAPTPTYTRMDRRLGLVGLCARLATRRRVCQRLSRRRPGRLGLVRDTDTRAGAARSRLLPGREATWRDSCLSERMRAMQIRCRSDAPCNIMRTKNVLKLDRTIYK